MAGKRCIPPNDFTILALFLYNSINGVDGKGKTSYFGNKDGKINAFWNLEIHPIFYLNKYNKEPFICLNKYEQKFYVVKKIINFVIKNKP